MSRSYLRYPLAWPLGHPRTPRNKIARSRFWQTGKNGSQRPPTFVEGRDRVIEELRNYNRRGQRIPWASVQISTDVPLRQDGYPIVGRRDPEDHGVVLYFTLDGVPYALPCDRWETMGENLAAIAAHLDALRGIERWGVGTAKEHFAGFAALPPAGASSAAKPKWFDVLGFKVGDKVNEQVIKAAFRERTKSAHPDTATGDHEEFIALQEAYEEALRFLRGRKQS